MRSILAIVMFIISASLYASTTVIDIRSQFGVQETVERYIEALKSADIPIHNKPMHNAKSVNSKIQFSHPFYGTIIGKCSKGSRKDKPFVTRIWSDQTGDVWLRYEEPTPLINQFGVIECGYETDVVIRSLTGFASSATRPE